MDDGNRVDEISELMNLAIEVVKNKDRSKADRERYERLKKLIG